MIKRGDKVIIAIGDSFTEGQGAYDDGIWETLDWMEPTKQSVINTFTEMERNNSWPSQLKKNHLKDYNIINLGNRGKGNRNAVKKLTTFSPQFDATLASEITIVFSFTQFCRFEFIAPDTDLGPGNLFETIWPSDPDFDDKDRLGHKDLWRGYGTAIFNDKSTTLEFISTLVELQNWCKLHNANLVVINQMEDLGYKSLMIKNIMSDTTKDHLNRQSKIIDQIDFNNWMYGEEDIQLIDQLLILNKQPKLRKKRNYAWYGQYIGKENKYWTPCSHPTKYGHKVLAKTVYEYLVKKEYV